MLLLTAIVTLGPGRNWPADKEYTARSERTVGLVTLLPFRNAVKLLKEYSDKFGGAERLSSITYRIISVTEIEVISDATADEAGFELIEELVREE